MSISPDITDSPPPQQGKLKKMQKKTMYRNSIPRASVYETRHKHKSLLATRPRKEETTTDRQGHPSTQTHKHTDTTRHTNPQTQPSPPPPPLPNTAKAILRRPRPRHSSLRQRRLEPRALLGVKADRVQVGLDGAELLLDVRERVLDHGARRPQELLRVEVVLYVGGVMWWW